MGEKQNSNTSIVDSNRENVLRKKDLKKFDPKDKMASKFEEILRHNNISDKENAFNKLVSLFICKLVDEITKEEDDIVDFQYKLGTDTYETLLDRLQRLYKEGMDKFMKEEIFYVSSEYPINLFSDYKEQNRKNEIDNLRETFRKLKFYSNSDFAFKDVQNEELFKQNGKILLEVIKLFERYRIVYPSKHQFLGDLFEQLLSQGFKQNEGQFFTPIPITRFIWESLPIENLKSLDKKDSYPKIIDYACGSGHFLTEGIDIINKIRDKYDYDWVSENIYGIEKDYRLARVSKISLFMNGAGNGNVIYGDGLDNNQEKGIVNGSFDILVANPPYSVKAFKSHLELKENNFDLMKFISNDGSEIEVLFIERIVQLLKPNGIAAVILPSSILSNTSNSYIGARDILLKNFKIKAIMEFSDKTFNATNTTTVVLFLEKYNKSLKCFKIMEDTIYEIFNNQKMSEWKNVELLESYLEHIGVEKDYYLNFIDQNIIYEKFIENEYFKMYVEDFKKSTELKNLLSKSSFKNLTDVEQKQRVNDMFYINVKKIEQEKMYYFSLIRDNETMVIKSPTTSTGQYEFLGYQWSNRKGSEGIQIKNEGGKLYCTKNRDSKKHISPLIRKFFNDDSVEIDDTLKEYVKIIPTKNMLDFDREKIERTISLVEKSVINIESKYSILKLKDLEDLKIIRGVTFPKKKESLSPTNNIILTSDNITLTNRLDIKKEIFVENGFSMNEEKRLCKNDIFVCFSSGSLKHVGKMAYIEEDLNKYAGGFMGILRLKENDYILSKYLFLILSSNEIDKQIKSFALGGNIKNLSSDIRNIKIPIPPIDIQNIIIEECNKIEEKYKTSRMKIEDYRSQIQKIFEDLDVVKLSGGGGRWRCKLSDLEIVFNPSKNEIKDLKNIEVSFIPMEFLSENGKITDSKIRNIHELKNGSYKYFIEDDVLIAKITPCMENGKCAIAKNLKNNIGFGSSEYHIFRCNKNKIYPEILFGFLNREKIRVEAINAMTGSSGHRRVPIEFYKNLTINLPSIDEQKIIINKTKELEDQIKDLEINQLNLKEQVSDILNNYLK